MSKEDNSSKKGAAESFSEMFKAFGDAVSEIFNDPDLRAKAKEFGNSVAESAKTFPSRFKDEEVKNKFRDVGKAAQDFGRSVGDTFRDKNYDSGKSADLPEYDEPPPSPE
jgi:hypothetical protein